MEHNLESARAKMVEHQLRRRGVDDPALLEVFGTVPRHLFVPAPLRERAYGDFPLPIGEGQTISQPIMVAMMTELLSLTGAERVLELGTGSGYQTAILSVLAREVVTIERHEALQSRARDVLAALGMTNIHFVIGDGTLGWAQAAPFDAIIVTAAAPVTPPPLLAQLAPGGRLVIPVGPPELQTLQLMVNHRSGLRTTDHGLCRFVKLIGEHGFPG